jgi:hypothetical protein
MGGVEGEDEQIAGREKTEDGRGKRKKQRRC